MNTKYYDRYRTLSLKISYYRKARGYTQLQLAEILNIDRSHMSAIELATTGVSLRLIFKLCEILDVTPENLFNCKL